MPADTVNRLLDLVSAGRYTELGPLLADDVELHLPYIHGDVSGPRGRSTVVEFLDRALSTSFSKLSFVVDQIYEVNDDSTVIVEYRSEGVRRASGEPYRNRYVGIFRTRDGLITLWREYLDPRQSRLANEAVTPT